MEKEGFNDVFKKRGKQREEVMLLSELKKNEALKILDYVKCPNCEEYYLPDEGCFYCGADTFYNVNYQGDKLKEYANIWENILRIKTEYEKLIAYLNIGLKGIIINIEVSKGKISKIIFKNRVVNVLKYTPTPKDVLKGGFGYDQEYEKSFDIAGLKLDLKKKDNDYFYSLVERILIDYHKKTDIN